MKTLRDLGGEWPGTPAGCFKFEWCFPTNRRIVATSQATALPEAPWLRDAIPLPPGLKAVAWLPRQPKQQQQRALIQAPPCHGCRLAHGNRCRCGGGDVDYLA